MRVQGVWRWLAACALALGAMLGSVAQATPIITITASGKILAGSGSFDDGSWTGVPVQSFDDLAVTMVQTLELMPGDTLNAGSDPSTSLFSKIDVAITIAGYGTKSFSATGSANAFGQLNLSTLGGSGTATLDSQTTTIDANGQLATSILLFSTVADLVQSANALVDQIISAPPSGSVTFGALFLGVNPSPADANSPSAWGFTAEAVDSISVVVTGLTVPEPASLAAVLTALLMLALVGLHRSRLARRR